MIRVFGDGLSGNCYKLKLLMALLGIDHEWQHVDVLAGGTRTPEFLRMNPNGKIPVLEIDEHTHLTESNAILHYLADGTAMIPREPLAHARMLAWQFFEQYSHEPYIAVARYINKYLGLPSDRAEEFHSKQAGGHKALNVMEFQLTATPYLLGDACTLADISLYAYTHVAEEGGFSLNHYPAIQAWLIRIEKLPRYVPMQR